MNIGLFVDAFVPVKNGVVTSVVQLKEYLEHSGHHVYVFTASAKNALKVDNVYRFPSFGISKATEVRLAIVDFQKIYNIAKELKLDIIHTHSEFSLAYAAKKLAKKFNIPIIHTTHTLWEHYQHYIFKGLVFKWIKIKPIIRRFLKPYQYLIYPSKKAFTYFSPITRLDSKFRIIPNGIDSNKFISQSLPPALIQSKRMELGFQKQDKIMIFVGRIGPEKRILELVTLLMPYLKEDPSLKFIVVGDGGYLEKLKNLSAEHGLSQQIIFTGFIPWNEVNQYYLISDLFITLSVSEVMPMTMIEALLSGLAIACIKDDAYDRMIDHRVNGVTLKTDHEVVKQAIALLSDTPRLNQYKQASLALSKQFSSNSHGEQVLKFYQYAIKDYRKTIKVKD